MSTDDTKKYTTGESGASDLDLEIPDINHIQHSAKDIIELRKIEFEYEKERNRMIQWVVVAVIGGSVAWGAKSYFTHQDKVTAWTKATAEVEISKRNQKLEEIKEFSKHEKLFADQIMGLLETENAENYSKVMRLATYMSTVPTSEDVKAGWRDFLSKVTDLHMIAVAEELSDPKVSTTRPKAEAEPKPGRGPASVPDTTEQPPAGDDMKSGNRAQHRPETTTDVFRDVSNLPRRHANQEPSIKMPNFD